MKTLNYDEYMTAVPEETRSFVRLACRYLAKYSEYVTLDVNGEDLTSTDLKVVATVMYAMSQDKNYSSFLSSWGVEFRSGDFASYLNNDFSSTLFNRFSKYFMTCKAEEDYKVLNPYAILYNLLLKMDEKNRISFFSKFSNEMCSSFMNALNEKNMETIETTKSKIKNVYFLDLRIELISYLDTVGKIFEYLRLNRNYVILQDKSDKQFKAIAYILGIFLYRDVNTDFNTKDVLVHYFNSVGLDEKKIFDTIGIEIKESAINNIDAIFALSKFFNEKQNSQSFTIDKLLENIYSKNSELRLYILNLFNACNIDDDEISNAISEVREARDDSTKVQIEQIYKDMMPETIKFINFAAKTYSYLTTIYKNMSYDGVIVQDDKDLVPLAMLIASFYFGGYVSNYMSDHDVDLSTIEKTLGIDLSKEKIEVTPLNEKILFRKFKCYTDKNKSSVDGLLKGITSYSTTESKVVQRLYATINKDNLPSDFAKIIDEYNKNVSKKKAMAEKDVFFKDCNPQIYDFLLETCKYYYYLAQIDFDFGDGDLETFAVVCAASSFQQNNSELADYLNSIELNVEAVEKFIGKSIYKKDVNDLDMAFVKEHFTELLFGGVNNDKKHSEVSIASIVENALSKNYASTFNRDRFLASIQISDDKVTSIELNMQRLREEKRKQRIRVLLSFIDEYGNDARGLLDESLKILSYLLAHKKELPLIKTDDDAEEISIVIAYFIKELSYLKFFKINDVTLDEIMHALGIDKETLDKICASVPDYSLLEGHLTKYFAYYMRRYEHFTSTDIIKNVFSDEINKSRILESITTGLGSKYEKLREEILTGKEIVRELTSEERLELLENDIAPKMDINSMEALVIYGNSLSQHSTFISDDFKNLERSDTLDDALNNVNALVSEIYTDIEIEPPKQGFFQRLFGTELPASPRVRRQVNFEALDNLGEKIDESIEGLTTELLGYNYLKKYIEAYLKALTGYNNEVLEEYNSAKEHLKLLSLDNDEDYAEFLNYSTIVEVLQDKATRFVTNRAHMKQELFKVHRAIVRHFITISALKSAKNDIIPLIGSELIIGVGQETELEALELSNNIVNLLHGILERNTEATKTVLDKLQASQLPQQDLLKIMDDVDTYINGISSLDKYRIPEEKSDAPITLKLEGDTNESIVSKDIVDSDSAFGPKL